MPRDSGTPRDVLLGAGCPPRPSRGDDAPAIVGPGREDPRLRDPGRGAGQRAACAAVVAGDAAPGRGAGAGSRARRPVVLERLPGGGPTVGRSAARPRRVTDGFL